MEFEQFYLGCLAHASYLLGSDGEAAVVDPQRDVDQYLERAAERGLRIRYVIETHLHADFVSGHRELAERSGAEVVFGARAQVGFPHRAVRDGDELPLGRVRLRVMETPGHTPEGICVLVIDEEGRPSRVLTGDTLFVGDVGRPDLAGGSGITPEAMASLMYDSLHRKLLLLPDAVEVFPAHGAGSLCGRSMSKERSSTIGAQRAQNPALQPMSREAFVRLVTSELPEAPAYFPRDVSANRAGAPALDARPAPPALSPAEVAQRVLEGATLLDVRSPAAFGAGHLPGSINLGLDGQFASWAGTLLPFDAPIVIVADDALQVEEANLRLARVGLESVAGSLEGGVPAWLGAGLEAARVPQASVLDLRSWTTGGRPGLQVLDVRRPAEYAAGHVPGASSAPLDSLSREAARFDAGRPTAVICASGYRSSAATGILQRHGFTDVANVSGGTSAWVAAGLPVEA